MSSAEDSVQADPALGVRRLVCGFSEPSRSRRLLLVLVAHIDASGNMGQEPVYVMAGYFAPVTAWEAFSRDWKSAIDKPRQTSVIKMTHLMARTKKYEGWSESERDAKLRLLAPIINRYAIGQINVVVPIQSWRKHFVGKLDRSYHNRPYYFAVHNIMATLAKYMHHHMKVDDKVHFIFDSEDAEPIAEIQSAYEQFKRIAPPFYQKYLGGMPHFEREEDILPLQAADILAWHIRQAYVGAARQTRRTPSSVIDRELFEGCKFIQCEWTDEQLGKAAEFILSQRLWKSH